MKGKRPGRTWIIAGILILIVAGLILIALALLGVRRFVFKPTHVKVTKDARVILFLTCLLCLLHFAHRFRFTLYDGLQIKPLNEVLNPCCYGAAIFGAVVAGYVIWNIP